MLEKILTTSVIKVFLRLLRNVKKNLNVKAIIPVDLYGLPANYDKINAIAKSFNLNVIADGAQSFGGVFRKKRVGNLTEITTTSFFPAKPLGCYGDGGAVFTNSLSTKEKLESLRAHGKEKRNTI